MYKVHLNLNTVLWVPLVSSPLWPAECVVVPEKEVR